LTRIGANYHELTKRDLTTEPMIGSKEPKLGLPMDTDKKRIACDVSERG
jgi:hypothetical protein